MQKIITRFKELSTFHKIFSIIYLIGFLGGVFRICASPMGSTNHSVLLAGYHMPGPWGSLVRLVYVLLLGAFLYGLFTKKEIGYHSIQTYHIILIVNGLSSAILYFFRLEYFIAHYSEKLLKLAGHEGFLGPKFLIAANVGSFIGLAILGLLLFFAFRKRRIAFLNT